MSVYEFSLIVFTSFFTLINPLALMPVFMSMTASMTVRQRNVTALKATLISLAMLLVFAFAGQFIFKFFSISIDSLRIVGGVIFFLVGFDMLQARFSRMKSSGETETEFSNDIAITPLAIPMICGPGSITNAIVLMEDSETFGYKMVLIGGLVAVMAITFVVLLSSGKLVKWMGDMGIKVMMRLMGLIVMIIAIEFFFAGLKPLLLEILNKVQL
ncbi:MAG: MarC family protein [Salinivirgaceae bacterium]